MTVKKKRKERAEAAKAKLLAQYIDGLEGMMVTRFYKEEYFLVYPKCGCQWPEGAIESIIGIAKLGNMSAEFLTFSDTITIEWGEK